MGIMVMRTSRRDLENSERNEQFVLWVIVIAILIGVYLAIVVYGQ